MIINIDDRVKRTAAIFNSLGFKKPESKVLAYLFQNEGLHTYREIELGVDLRQPEVSTASKSLEGQGWVVQKIMEDARRPRGRPQVGLGLAMPKDMLKDKLIEMANKGHQETVIMIRSL